MATFKFRLTTLLRVRETERDERRTALAEVQRADDLLRQALAFVEQELEQLHERCRRAAAPGPVDIDRLVEAQRYELALRGRQQQLAAERAALAAEVDRRTEALLAADREVRTLEKLRERQADEHGREAHRRHARQSDEMAQLHAVQEVG